MHEHALSAMYSAAMSCGPKSQTTEYALITLMEVWRCICKYQMCVINISVLMSLWAEIWKTELLLLAELQQCSCGPKF